MAFAERFQIATEKEKTVAVARLVKASTGDFDFYIFAVFGIAMASLGLVLNSPEVVIGGMLIAPVLYPLLSLSLSMVLVDLVLFYRSLQTLAISFGVSIVIAFTISIAISPFGLELGEQILARATPSALYFFVAFVSGFAATYAMVHANLNEMLPGVAISVSLVPPLAVIGIGLAAFDWGLAGGAAALFALNVVGIAFASLIAFSLMDLHSTRRIADSAIRQEDRRLEEESQKIEEIQQEETNNNHE